MAMIDKKSEFGSEYLLIFIGYSGDASDAADTIAALEAELQRELDKLRRVNPSVTFNRIKMWKWDADAAPAVGGQATVITPALERANVAVFVFKERIGEVAWHELGLVRQRQPPVPVLPFFPANPPSTDRMMIDSVAEQWTDLLKKKRSLAAGWMDIESNALTPLPQYKDIKDLSRISSERLVAEVVRLASAFANPPRDAPNERNASDSAAGDLLEGTLRLGKLSQAGHPAKQSDFVRSNRGNVLSIAPGGEGRYSATVVRNLGQFGGPTLVFDPTGQVYQATADERERLGPVVKLDPWGMVPDGRIGSLNPYGLLLALGLSPNEAARQLADYLVPYTIYHYRRRESIIGWDPFWSNMQRKLLIGLIVLVASESQNNEAIFSRIRSILYGDDVTYNFAVKLDTKGKEMDSEAYQELASFLSQAEGIRTSIIAGVSQHVAAFGSSLAQRATDSTSFDADSWVRGDPLSIYVIGPPAGITSFESVYRAWLGVLLAPVLRRPRNQRIRTLLVVDMSESFELTPGLVTAITAENSIESWLLAADLSDVQSAFGEAADAIINSMSVLQTLRPKNHVAASRIASLFGIEAAKLMEMKQSEVYVATNGEAPAKLTRMD